MYAVSIRGRLGRGLLLACLLLPCLLVAQVQIALDRSTIAVGEAAKLTVSIDGTGLNSYPEIPPIEGLSFTQTSAAQSTSIVNGVRSVKINISYVIQAAKEGQFTIGPVKVKADGKFHQSQTVMLKVAPGSKPAVSAADELNKVAFIKVTPPKAELYVGEIFPLELNLYFQNARGEIPQLKADGFSLSSPPIHTQGRVRLPTGIYNQHTFRYAAKALKTGDLTLGPAQGNLEVQIPVQEADPFFGGMVQRYRSQPMTVKSEVLNLKVLPLPEEGRPASFNGAVGRFGFRATAVKDDVAVGDPVILQVEIAGMGTWDAVQLPPMNDWRDFKIYPPNSEFKPLDDLGIQGSKRFELVVVPENSGIKEIPAMAFSYFDTESRKYETIKVAAIPLRVRASSGAPAQPTITSGNVQPAANEPAPAKDILHIKPHFGTATAVSAPVLVRPWFWVVNALPLLAWAALLFWRQQADKAARNPRAQRARAVAQSEAAGLTQLTQLAASGSSKEFFDLLAKLLQERLGERLDVPASAITESVIEERLGPAGVKEDVRRELHELFQACNQARYAPVSDVAKLDALVERAKKVLEELMRVEVRG